MRAEFLTFFLLSACGTPSTPIGEAVDEVAFVHGVERHAFPSWDCPDAQGYMLPADDGFGRADNRVLLVPFDQDERAVAAWLTEGAASEGCFHGFADREEDLDRVETDAGIALAPVPYIVIEVKWE